jgi:meiotically up-regulated gene 157 (Mug157) protein
MSATINPEALAAVLELCDDDTLDTNIRLMEDSIDVIIDEDSIPADNRLDLISAYRRLGKQFRTIQSLITQ